MKRYWAAVFALLCIGIDIPIVLGQDLAPTPTEATTVPKPLVLKSREKMRDSESHRFPKPPKTNPDGTPWKEVNDDKAFWGPALTNLIDPTFFQGIEDFNKNEKKSGNYYWHKFQAWDYCHYRDGSGNQWYGWRTGSLFHWVLLAYGRFWWHDTFAERWLFFDKGYWWWQSGSKNSEIQVYLEDGHYHACNAEGVLGEDLMETGKQEVATKPVEKEVTPSADALERRNNRNSTGALGGGF